MPARTELRLCMLFQGGGIDMKPNHCIKAMKLNARFLFSLPERLLACLFVATTLLPQLFMAFLLRQIAGSPLLLTDELHVRYHRGRFGHTQRCCR